MTMQMTPTSAGIGRDWLRPLSALTAIVGVASLAVAVSTPPHSGPFCQVDCISYPYSGGVEFVPRDFLWMYPATLFLLLFLALTVVIHQYSDPRVRTSTAIGVVLTAISVGILLIDYSVQLMVVQPSLVAGETDQLALLSQYNGHGIFIALENAGYAGLALAFVALAPGISRRWLATTLYVTGIGTLISLVVMGFRFGAQLEYRFEVLAISVTWLVMIITGGALASRRRL